MARGIERGRIFRRDRDRRDCLDRLARTVTDSDAALYAWCLMPNHVHVVVRTGTVSLGRLMQRWIGAYATLFNRRHDRVGHLFQNRFKSFVVDEEGYLLELVRYVHLNPLRAGLVSDLDALDRFPWTGHAVLLGRRHLPAQNTDLVLQQFADGDRDARAAYRAFVAAGLPAEAPLAEVGLRRGADGWERRENACRGRDRWGPDEKVLGGPAFVDQLLQGERAGVRQRPGDASADGLLRLVRAVGDAVGLTVEEITSQSRRPAIVGARATVSLLAVRHLGLPLSAVARALRVSPQSVLRGIERAARRPDLRIG